MSGRGEQGTRPQPSEAGADGKGAAAERTRVPRRGTRGMRSLRRRDPPFLTGLWPLSASRKWPAGGNKRYVYAGRKLRGYFFICRLRPGAFPKPISFSLAEKETVFECQRKRGLMALLKRWQKRYGGVRLYAHGVDRPRPLRPAPVEQGKAVVLSLSRLVFGPCGRGCVTPLNGRRYGLIRRKCLAVGPRSPLLRRRTCLSCTGGVTT